MITQEFAARYWWTVSQAARAWGVNYTTALRAMRRGEGFQAYVLRPDGRSSEAWYCLRDQPRIPGYRGNPLWRSSEYQRQLINRRWAMQRRRRELAAEVDAEQAEVERVNRLADATLQFSRRIDAAEVLTEAITATKPATPLKWGECPPQATV